MKTQKQQQKGFTLIELVVVIAVLAILAAVAIPSFNGYTKKANEAVCLANRSVIRTQAVAAMAADPALAGQIRGAGGDISALLAASGMVNFPACPTEGTYAVYFAPPMDVEVNCSLHAPRENGGGFYAGIKQIYDSLPGYVMGTTLRSKLMELMGGRNVMVNIGGTSYYLKVDRQTGSSEPTLYAGTKFTDWRLSALYDDTTDTWYQYIAGDCATSGRSKADLLGDIAANPQNWQQVSVTLQ
ncbi:MAG: prepilin-type N-terminal cleavage/methylation domain-containing protein [Eubacteriales bacterium]|nr:prepilin-type N-terminal cleavage/methylation domain-containing protein [Eubacteriales bacterium]